MMQQLWWHHFSIGAICGPSLIQFLDGAGKDHVMAAPKGSQPEGVYPPSFSLSL